MKKLFILIFSIVIAGELEVDGDLKVNGTVDAQGNPITNVGAPQTLTDAVNAGILASALSDDGVYEYKIVATKIDYNWLSSSNNGNGFQVSYKLIGSDAWISNFEGYLSQLSNDGWQINQILPYLMEGYSNSFYWNQYIFRRPISDD